MSGWEKRILHLLKKCIRLLRIKNLITGHDGNQIFCVREIDDVMRPSRNHVDCFNLITRNLEADLLPGVDVPFFNQTMPMNHNKLLPLGVVPVLPLGDARFANVDADIS